MGNNSHYCDSTLLRRLNRTHGIAKAALARLCVIDPKSASWYVDGVMGCGKINAERIMSALGVTLDELEGRITDERLLEVAELIRRAPRKPYRPVSKQRMLDQSKWTERTCRLCGAQYRVGSLTTCGDCIWGSYHRYSPQEHSSRVRTTR